MSACTVRRGVIKACTDSCIASYQDNSGGGTVNPASAVESVRERKREERRSESKNFRLNNQTKQLTKLHLD